MAFFLVGVTPLPLVIIQRPHISTSNDNDAYLIFESLFTSGDLLLGGLLLLLFGLLCRVVEDGFLHLFRRGQRFGLLWNVFLNTGLLGGSVVLLFLARYING